MYGICHHSKWCYTAGTDNGEIENFTDYKKKSIRGLGSQPPDVFISEAETPCKDKKTSQLLAVWLVYMKKMIIYNRKEQQTTRVKLRI